MPLLFDMPLEQLPTYQGSSPRPPDFDAWWQRALAEQRATDPDPDLVPAAFQTDFADCFHLYFSGTRGARVHAKFLRPKAPASPGPAVLMFHGYAGNAGPWLDKLGYVAQGFAPSLPWTSAVRADSRRSPAATAGRPCAAMPSAASTARPTTCSIVRSTSIPSSWPALSWTCPASTPTEFPPPAAVRVAPSPLPAPRLSRASSAPRPSTPWLTDIKRVFGLRSPDQVNAWDELAEWFRNFDPRHEREKEIFTRLGYVDVQFLAPRVQAEVMMGTGLMDTICPPSSQYAAYNKITSPKSVRHYHDHGHETLPGHQDAIFEFLSAKA